MKNGDNVKTGMNQNPKLIRRYERGDFKEWERLLRSAGSILTLL